MNPARKKRENKMATLFAMIIHEIQKYLGHLRTKKRKRLTLTLYLTQSSQ